MSGAKAQGLAQGTGKTQAQHGFPPLPLAGEGRGEGPRSRPLPHWERAGQGASQTKHAPWPNAQVIPLCRLP